MAGATERRQAPARVGRARCNASSTIWAVLGVLGLGAALLLYEDHFTLWQKGRGQPICPGEQVLRDLTFRRIACENDIRRFAHDEREVELRGSRRAFLHEQQRTANGAQGKAAEAKGVTLAGSAQDAQTSEAHSFMREVEAKVAQAEAGEKEASLSQAGSSEEEEPKLLETTSQEGGQERQAAGAVGDVEDEQQKGVAETSEKGNTEKKNLSEHEEEAQDDSSAEKPFSALGESSSTEKASSVEGKAQAQGAEGASGSLNQSEEPEPQKQVQQEGLEVNAAESERETLQARIIRIISNNKTEGQDSGLDEDDENEEAGGDAEDEPKRVTGGAGKTSGSDVDAMIVKVLKPTYPGVVTCKAPRSLWLAYFTNYTHGGDCPDDWPVAQKLLMMKDCLDLPKRDCFARFPPKFQEPLPRSVALWSDPDPRNIMWQHYAPLSSFEDLRTRVAGRAGGGSDCRECFDWTSEQKRWRWLEAGNMNLDQILALKDGSIRLGLDIAGGSGSFAAQLLANNVTVVTTGMNTGAPFLETMALRGLPALHLPLKARLPFFDYTFDLIHSQHAVQMLSLEDFEFMLFDWDRVLRPGGIIWLEKLYQPDENILTQYIEKVAMLRYRRYSWVRWTRHQQHRFSAVIEKPFKREAL